MNSFQLINSNALDCDYPLELRDIQDGSFKYEILSGVFMRVAKGNVFDIRYSNNIASGLISSRFWNKLSIENERVFVEIGDRAKLNYFISINIHVHQPIFRGKSRSGEINAPISKRHLRSWYISCALKMDFILRNSFHYSKFDCIYFLLKENVIQYVGQSTDVSLRISQHIKDADKDFDMVTVMCCYDEKNLNALENFYILKFIPPQQGRWPDGRLVVSGSVEEDVPNMNLSEVVIKRYIDDFRSRR